MNILHLKYAVEVAKLGSLSKAAEALLTAQPNISRSIKELEADLGITIFSRSAKGMMLTPEGEELISYAKSILKQIEQVELHYKNGKLCKIYTHFQKNDLEEPEIETIEGDSAIADYSFYFIDYTASPSTVVNEIQSKIGYTSVRIRKAN